VAVTVIGSTPVTLTLSDVVATTAGVSRNFTVTAKDSYGQVASGYTGTVFFTSTDVQAGLPASYTFTKGDAGSHTFTVTFKTSGIQSVTAADRDNSTILASSSVVVSPAAFTTLAVSDFTATTAGVAKTFSVSARDAYGNVVTSFTDPIGFNRAHWQDTLPVAYSFTAADAGVHTFSATLKFADSNSYISATDTKRWISGTQSGIAVSPAAMVGFAESRPTPLVAGASAPIVVTAVDAFGNAIPSYRGSVRLTSSDRQAILPADYTFTSSDAGSHSFAVSLKTAGTQSVTAIDSAATNLTGITWIGVNPAAATTLVIAGLPSAVTAGVMNSITVIAKDAYGNKATGYTGTVALVSNDAQAILPAEYLFTASDAGVHTFTFAAMTVGQQSLVPIDTNLVSIISTASWLTVI